MHRRALLCGEQDASGPLAAVYWVIFMILCVQFLLNLLLGMIADTFAEVQKEGGGRRARFKGPERWASQRRQRKSHAASSA